ncbi:CD63 antigen [Copidosoma floridanum]|uniref:CD63 antigen n=1 Tax=Copidosoma floridanum TaxID=29053 RepID=UPI0006C9AD47|nr:CD63 antigen [Copidosoma floridanum]
MGWFSNNFGNPQYIKYLLFVLNFLFVITGIVLIAIGSSVTSSYSPYHHLLDGQFFSIPTLLVTIGIIIFVIAFFGCYGAMRENYCMILTFAAFMTLIFVLELAAGISGYVLRGNASEVVEHSMKEKMPSYTNNSEIYEFWDRIQRDFKCCGIHESKDWIKAWEKAQRKDWVESNALPLTCCQIEDGLTGNFTCAIGTNTTAIHGVGCVDKIIHEVRGHALQLGGVGLGIAFCQVLGIWFALFLAKTIKKNYLNM